jgi:hypothetical protein
VLEIKNMTIVTCAYRAMSVIADQLRRKAFSPRGLAADNCQSPSVHAESARFCSACESAS